MHPTFNSLIKGEKEEALPRSHQAFDVAAAQTSRLVNLVFSYPTDASIHSLIN